MLCAPFSHVARLQGLPGALLQALRSLQLQTLDADKMLPDDSTENALLLALMHLMNDYRIQMHTFPDSALFGRLPALLQAVVRAPAATQSGMAAYALLSPVAATFDDMAFLARGNKDCLSAVHELQAKALADVGLQMWHEALKVSKHSTSAFMMRA
jgi:hypothetical protein